MTRPVGGGQTGALPPAPPSQAGVLAGLRLDETLQHRQRLFDPQTGIVDPAVGFGGAPAQSRDELRRPRYQLAVELDQSVMFDHDGSSRGDAAYR